MIAPTNITPPKNWQDFENLCLKLWGEIWNIPHDIDYNSDNSQGQQGVDIYGAVNGGLQYFGIQCKNKKLNLIDGSPNRISTKDIQTEIDNAKSFKPSLTKLIIATSLPKDQKVEEYVRVKNVENLQAGLFSIQICFWDYFERKIPEFQKVYDWYLKNENFHRVREISISFSDGSLEKTIQPKFQKNINRFLTKTESKKQDSDIIKSSILNNSLYEHFQSLQIVQEHQDRLMSTLINNTHEWQQLCWFSLNIKNNGEHVIEDFKIELDFEGEFVEVGTEHRSPLLSPNFKSNVKEYSNSKTSLLIKPFSNILVQGDSFETNDIYIIPRLGKLSDVKMHWKLLSRDFEDSGFLEIKIRPLYYSIVKDYIVDSPEEEIITESISHIVRKGFTDMFGRIQFQDKESDFKFE